MITFYIKNKEKFLQAIPYEKKKSNLINPIWIDVLSPTPEEERSIEELFGIKLPNFHQINEIEMSNRLYQKDNCIFLTGSFITTNKKTHPITFIITKKILITIRYMEFLSFEKYLNYSKKNASNSFGNTEIFMDLLDANIGQIADHIEETGNSIDEITQVIFHSDNNLNRKKIDFKSIMRKVGKSGDLISKSHESLMSIYRIIKFLSELKNFKLNLEDLRKLKIITNDIPPLKNHATFLSNKITFLLDACLGMINIEQNNIIKVVSFTNILFLPPTLIASMYGMNFIFMPELKWDFGYPFAIIIMILSGFLPYFYFKLKDWL